MDSEKVDSEVAPSLLTSIRVTNVSSLTLCRICKRTHCYGSTTGWGRKHTEGQRTAFVVPSNWLSLSTYSISAHAGIVVVHLPSSAGAGVIRAVRVCSRTSVGLVVGLRAMTLPRRQAYKTCGVNEVSQA